jgi:hypothetical protein
LLSHGFLLFGIAPTVTAGGAGPWRRRGHGFGWSRASAIIRPRAKAAQSHGPVSRPAALSGGGSSPSRHCRRRRVGETGNVRPRRWPGHEDVCGSLPSARCRRSAAREPDSSCIARPAAWAIDIPGKRDIAAGCDVAPCCLVCLAGSQMGRRWEIRMDIESAARHRQVETATWPQRSPTWPKPFLDVAYGAAPRWQCCQWQI